VGYRSDEERMIDDKREDVLKHLQAAHEAISAIAGTKMSDYLPAFRADVYELAGLVINGLRLANQIQPGGR
jgi:hypothetical protein